MIRSRYPAAALVGALVAASPAPSFGQDQADPFIWLEDVESDRSMEWVTARNEATLAELSVHPAFDDVYDRSLEILDSDDRIAYPSIMGDLLYNFWQDSDHERGIWRRTTWSEYLSDDPAWEIVLDVDSLAAAEGVNWSYGGASCRPPEYRLCLVRLSRGGADAVEIREFDVATGRFVDNGFFLPEAKQSVAWAGEDALLVATDFGEGSQTTSGYARIAKLWERGTLLSAARTLFEGEPDDVMVGVGSFRTADRAYEVVYHRPSFFEGSTYVHVDGDLVKLDLPLDADPSLVRDRLVVYLRSPWETPAGTYPAGSLVATSMDDFLGGSRHFDVLLDPDDRATIESVRATRDYLLVGILDNVRSQLWRYTFDDGTWTADRIPTPEHASVSVGATSPLDNRFFYTLSGYTQPTTLYLADADSQSAAREVRAMPAMFDAAGLIVEQHEATSRDGARIPYFVVRDENADFDGDNPTLLYGYGGFEISMTPGYNATTGALWLERGGAYAVANIRGGGEFGPTWHRAALKENRQLAYDDFIAVAEDLVARGVTSPARLGIIGGSNGGLLVGAAFTQRPDLFNAVVAQVPLLDMRRYNKLLAGASWMAEYGNPDIPEEWAYISRYSPYQNIDENADYPRVLFTTTTRDDRVHPGHARKMAAKMMSMGYPVYYYENTEGGHGAGVTSEQRARMQAIVHTYLIERLMDGN
jgi:prolyl oligopeptidase